jgi:hypothetical protein
MLQFFHNCSIYYKKGGYMKQGYKTTEFWLTMIATGWSMFGGAIPQPWGGALAIVGTGLYSIARGLAKAGVLKGTVGADLAKN